MRAAVVWLLVAALGLLAPLEVHSGASTVEAEWRAALRSEDDQRHLNATRALLQLQSAKTSPDMQRWLCRLNLGAGADMPPLHFLLNMYFKNRDSEMRKALVLLMLKCIDAGSDVKEQFGKDPSVIFKALVMREMNLAKALAAAAAANTTSADREDPLLVTRSLLTQLYSVPCELVPLAKLLLHANTIVSRNAKGLVGFGGVDGIKRLISSANLGVQSKPAVKGDDLAALSGLFTDLISAFGSSKFQLNLKQLISVLDEVAASIHQQLIFSASRRGGLAPVLAVLAESEEITLRNGFHNLGISGASIMINQLIEETQRERARNENSVESLEKLSQSLVAHDVYGMLPSSYALARFGGKSDIYRAMLRLCHLVSEALYEVCAGLHPIRLTMKASKASILSTQTEVDVSGEGALRQTINVGDDGGWNTNRLKDEFAGDVNRCDILEVYDVPPSSEVFHRDYVLTSTPVIFRSAAKGKHLQEAFRKDAFLSVYGADLVDVGAIPYPSSFGVVGKRITLQEAAELDSQVDASVKTPSLIPSYAFSTPSQAWQARLLKDAPLPSFAPRGSSSEFQFYLGPAGSGAPMHFHGHAINTMAFGEKHWFLLPPDEAFYSTLPASEFVPGVLRGNESSTWQCTQFSGDILYVPSLWSHATLNIKQTIGVAHEFSFESFCMN